MWHAWRVLSVVLALLAGACGSGSSPGVVTTARASPACSPPRPATPDLSPSERRTDGATLLFRPSDPSSAQNPAFSPDDRTLLFTLFHSGYNRGPAGLELLALPDLRSTPLLDEPGSDNVNLPGASWNPCTNNVAFASDRGGISEIWVLAPGAELEQVTRHSDSRVFSEPSFSPDGKSVVFEISATGDDERRQASIWTASLDGMRLSTLVDGPATGTDNRQPNWSARGDSIVYQSRPRRADTWSLWTIAPDGSRKRRLTNGPTSDSDASWSPDGGAIIYSDAAPGSDRATIGVISADGTEAAKATDSMVVDGAPSWSHDGRWIAFESQACPDRCPASLWIVHAPTLGRP